MYYNETQNTRNIAAEAVREYQFRLRQNMPVDDELETLALATLAQWAEDEAATEAAR